MLHLAEDCRASPVGESRCRRAPEAGRRVAVRVVVVILGCGNGDVG
jgi:hypothetical protein